MIVKVAIEIAREQERCEQSIDDVVARCRVAFTDRWRHNLMPDSFTFSGLGGALDCYGILLCHRLFLKQVVFNRRFLMIIRLRLWFVFASFVASTCQAFVAQSLLAAPPSSVTSLQASQLLEFEEPTTGVKVKLVGTMHYNPTSIQLAKETIQNLAQANKLGSIVIESCDLRWNQTDSMNPLFQKLLNSEMKAACDLALEYDRPVVLGDQRINVTVQSMAEGFRETLSHVVNPVTGWSKLATDLTAARKRALPFGDDANLNFASLLDPKLLAAAPVSLAKYPLSYLVKSPLFAISVCSVLFFLDQHSGNVPYDEMTVVDWLGSLGFAALETAIFARVLLKELLADRNEVIARNILEQCKLYQPKNRWNMLPSWMAGKEDSNVCITYVDGSNVSKNGGNDDGDDKEVVAVMGMAHCNGIMKLLKEQRV